MTHRIRDNPGRQRYELEVDGALAFIDYRRDGRIVAMTHAEVPIELRGGGIGSQLVQGALLLARARRESHTSMLIRRGVPAAAPRVR